MRIHHTEALVLKRTDFSNTSQILDLFTRDRGRVPVIAKGARQYHRRASRLVDLLYRGDAVILAKPSREVQILADFDTRDHFPGLRRHLARYHAGLHLAHLLRRGTRPEVEDPRLYSLAVRALARFATAPLARLPAEVLAFDVRFVAVIGFQLVLATCPRCGARHAPGRGTCFNPTAGGFLCRGCSAPGLDRALPCSAATRETLRRLATLAGEERDRVELTAARAREARRIMDAALTSVLEAKLPMLRFLYP